MKHTTHPMLPVLICTPVAALAGFLGAQLAADHPASPDDLRAIRADSHPESIAELAVTVEKLSEAVEGLRGHFEVEGELASARRPAGETPLVRGPSAAHDPELEGSIRELIAVLRESAALAHRATAPVVGVPDRVDRATAFASFMAGPRSGGLFDDEVMEEAMKAFNDFHLLWATNDVLATYGSPDEAHRLNNGGAIWEYELENVDGSIDSYSFHVDGDRVYRSDLYREEPE